MPSKSKSKGNGAERELCQMLKGIFNGPFIRVPNSGAFIGGSNAHRKANMSAGQTRAAKGDIQTPDFMPKLVLESKFYADFAFHSLLTDGNVPQLDKWIEQTVDCVEPGDLWFVAFKINRRGWFACFLHDLAPQFVIGNHAVYSDGKQKYVVTELMKFFTDNKAAILTLSK